MLIPSTAQPTYSIFDETDKLYYYLAGVWKSQAILSEASMSLIVSEVQLANWIKEVSAGRRVSTQPIQNGWVCIGRTHNGTSQSPVGQRQIPRRAASFPNGKLRDLDATAFDARDNQKKQTEWWVRPPQAPTLYEVHRFSLNKGKHTGGHLAFLLVVPEDIVYGEGKIDPGIALQECYTQLAQLGLNDTQAAKVIAAAGTTYAVEAAQLVATTLAHLNNRGPATVTFLQRLRTAKRRDRLNWFDTMRFAPSTREVNELSMITNGAAVLAEVLWG